MGARTAPETAPPIQVGDHLLPLVERQVPALRKYCDYFWFYKPTTNGPVIEVKAEDNGKQVGSRAGLLLSAVVTASRVFEPDTALARAVIEAPEITYPPAESDRQRYLELVSLAATQALTMFDQATTILTTGEA